MTALQLLKNQIKEARETFEGTVADVTAEQLHKSPGGKALPLGSVYAHLLFSEDIIIHGMLQGKPPLYETTWKDKTGASEPMPPMDEKWSASHEVWSQKVQIDLVKLREYAKAVYAQTDAYVATLTEADLDKEIDLGTWGKKTVESLLSGFIVGHTCSLTGEISVLKGIQGAKGYPF